MKFKALLLAPLALASFLATGCDVEPCNFSVDCNYPREYCGTDGYCWSHPYYNVGDPFVRCTKDVHCETPHQYCGYDGYCYELNASTVVVPCGTTIDCNWPYEYCARSGYCETHPYYDGGEYIPCTSDIHCKDPIQFCSSNGICYEK